MVSYSLKCFIFTFRNSINYTAESLDKLLPLLFMLIIIFMINLCLVDKLIKVKVRNIFFFTII